MKTNTVEITLTFRVKGEANAVNRIGAQEFAEGVAEGLHDDWWSDTDGDSWWLVNIRPTRCLHLDLADSGYICTLTHGHTSDHEARDAVNDHLIQTWPRTP